MLIIVETINRDYHNTCDGFLLYFYTVFRLISLLLDKCCYNIHIHYRLPFFFYVEYNTSFQMLLFLSSYFQL